MISQVLSAAFFALTDRESLTFAEGDDGFMTWPRSIFSRRGPQTPRLGTGGSGASSRGIGDVAFRTPPAPYEKSKSLGSGGSMVARLKLKGIDGRAPPGVEPAA
ncbi:hypothetical protein Sango_1497500 [Sesamum angolense]|uniref:Uncharacterized protein n=1 Tax=Sesamum angolense TaxID=2727404 RepID=A0AAE1WNI8_9LAMI|nr:hypothetical protein Sango_1497500 [Sesamum angolense]